MNRSKIWIAFLCVLVVLTGYFAINAGVALRHYLVLSEPANGAIEAWEVEDGGSSGFQIIARYIYLVGDQVYHGRGLVQGMSFRNRWAAIEQMKELGIKGWTVWYCPTCPDQSSLGKVFPLKQCVYAGIMGALLLYFSWLALRVRRLSTTQ